MGDDLQDKPRKELKELCSQNNIRTAGVKHEDLVRLLRNKLYPSAPSTPRSTSSKSRGAKEPSPGKDSNGDSYKTPVKTGGKSRNLRSSTLPVDRLPRENEAPKELSSFQRKNSGLSRKPLLTKSNTFSPRSRADVRSKAPGVDQDAQENAYLHQRSVRRTGKVNGLSPLGRKGAEAPGQLETASKESSVRSGGGFQMAQTDANARREDLTSSRALEDDPSGSAVEPSDAGSDASRRVSEVATDAGPDAMSDFSDADEFRSVSSEPISRFSSLGKRSSLRTESSKMSLLSAQSGLSFFTAGSWGSDNSRSLDNLLASVEGNDARRAGAGTEDVFPEFPEGSDFLVGDADALELSFLDAGAADPEMIVDGKDHGVKADRFNAMHSPMARDYVNYNRGSETDVREDGVGSSRVSIADLTSDQDVNLRDVNLADSDVVGTSVNAADKEGESPAAALPSEDHAESKELGRVNGEALPRNDLAPGTGAVESKRSCSGDIAKEDYVANEVSKDDHQPNESTSAGNLSEIALDMEHSDVDGWGVDTPTQPSESRLLEDGTSSISNGVRYSEGHSSHAEPTPDESEVHSRLPEGEASSESGSPAFDSRDYSVAKKLEFDSVEITQLASLPPAEHNVEDKGAVESNFQNPKEGLAVHAPETVNSSDSSPTNTSGDNTAPELDRAGCPVDEQEGYNVKSRDGHCASTCEAVHDYNKPLQDGREKEDLQAKVSFPLSIILWCSQSCSPTSRNRSQSLTS